MPLTWQPNGILQIGQEEESFTPFKNATNLPNSDGIYVQLPTLLSSCFYNDAVNLSHVVMLDTSILILNAFALEGF